MCISLLALPLSATEPEIERGAIWDRPLTVTLPEKAVQVGIFQPLRYGLSDKVELSSHPVLDFVIPNISAKISHGRDAGRRLATRHTLVYPTPLLRLIQKKGIGGIIAEDPTIPDMPHMGSLRSEILMSIAWPAHHYLTGKAGVVVAVRAGNLDSRTTIDLPVVYPRLAPYYNRFGFNGGMDIQGPMTGKVNYLLDADIFWLPGMTENIFLEQKGLIRWKIGPGWLLELGYKLTYGQYPYGEQWHLLPLFDMQWLWH